MTDVPDKVVIESLQAQLEAHKSMLNDSLNNVLNLKANVFILQKQNGELNNKISVLVIDLKKIKDEMESSKSQESNNALN